VRLRAELAPSQALAVLLATVHFGAALLLLPLALPLWAKIGLAAMLITSLAFHLLRDAWLRLNRSVTAIDLVRDTTVGLSCEITLKNGTRRRCRLLRSSVVVPMLVLLNVRTEDSRLARGIAILPDMLSEEDFRALRVLLRWGWRAPS
jgi:toxin CptA